jgi:AraC-like DNA-binding protein
MRCKCAVRLLVFLFCFAYCLVMMGDDRCFRLINASNGLWDNNVQQIFQLPDSRMVVATAGNVNLYDGASFSYIHKRHSHYFTLTDYDGYFHIYLGRDNYLWIKDRHSLRCVDLCHESYVYNIDSLLQKVGITCRVNDFFVDGSHRIWIVSGNKLIGEDIKSKFQICSSYGRVQDVDVFGNRLYVFLSYGYVSCYDLRNGHLIYSKCAYSAANQKNYSLTSTVVKDGRGKFYQLRLGKNHHSVLLTFDSRSERWMKLMETPYFLHALSISSQEDVYIACEKGYWWLDAKNPKGHLCSYLPITNGKSGSYSINSLCIDKDGGLWLATNKRGVLYSKPHQSPFKTYPLHTLQMNPLNKIIASRPVVKVYQGYQCNVVYKDSRGWIWVGTYDGLKLYVNKKRQPFVFYTDNGLSNNVIRSIIEDKYHNIWLGTGYGINFLKIDRNPKNITITSYQNDEGVLKEEFNDNGALILQDGTIAMQGIDGWTLFNPDHFTTLAIDKDLHHQLRFTPLLTKLYVRGENIFQNVVYDGNLIIEQSLACTDHIRLKYYQNAITLAFSAMNYFRPTQTNYRYRLIGSEDTTWHVLSYNSSYGLVDRQGVAHLPFSDLRPGRYRLEVMATMNPNIWLGGKCMIDITIQEPWWQSNSLYFVIGLLLLVLVIVDIRLYSMVVKKRTERSERDHILLFRLREYIDRCKDFSEKNFYISPLEDKSVKSSNDMSIEEIHFMTNVMSKVNDKNKELSVDKISSLMHLDRSKFYDFALSVIFKSPRTLIIYQKILQVKEHLDRGETNMSQIADATGFSSVEYMEDCYYDVCGTRMNA